MDEDYDCVIMGTGLTECIISGLMSIEGKKVLHLDRNKYYGGKSTSLSPLSSLFDHFGINEDLAKFQRDKDWNVDLIPKFIMANGKMVMLLIHTDVLKYLQFKHIEGSYVYQAGSIHKVPSNEEEALASNLMSLFEKRRFRKFIVWAMNVDTNEMSTVTDVYAPPLDIKKDAILHAFNTFQIAEDTQSFIGHAICLYPDDSYKSAVPAIEVIERIQLYSKSVLRFGKSPYIYPMYGLGELPQAFARLSAVHGGTYMLRTPVDKIVLEGDHVVGVQSGGQTARCKFVVCDPSYAPDKVKKVGQVVRAVCILSHPIPQLEKISSSQIIIPQSVTGRKNDIYISCLSHTHMVCPENFFIVLVATTVETADPKSELKCGLDLLGDPLQTFYSVDDLFEPIDDGIQSKIFISCSYDASTHVESVCADVESLYKRITGEAFDFSKVKQLISKWQEANLEA